VGSSNSHQPETLSRDWYDEFFRRAGSSEAHSRLCERVYGEDLCQHGLMHMEELDFLLSLIKPRSRIVDVGCGNGYITEAIHDRTHSTVLGLDLSGVAIQQARRRTQHKAATLQFQHIDVAEQGIPGSDYDVIIFIDSIQFLGDLRQILRRASEKLSPPGSMVISMFEIQREGDPADILLPDGTRLAQALRELQLGYTWQDFTAPMRAHGMENERALEELREAFEAEGNEFVYEARAAEIRHFRTRAERDEISRYMYLVERPHCPSLAGSCREGGRDENDPSNLRRHP
jgi:2-polyprenyl-3-methyl-5-hydroxy-6-metoxy-1,4-benzoquinol methylase